MIDKIEKNQTILVTGGTGFAGTHLIEELINQGYKNIFATHFGNQNLKLIKSLIGNNNVIEADLTDKEITNSIFKQIKPTQIYHLAAIAAVGSSFDKIKWTIDTNTALQLNILESTKQITPESRLLVIGSAMEYRPSDEPLSEKNQLGPTSPYGVSKLTQSMLAYSYFRAYKTNVVIARSFNHIGIRQAKGFVVPDFASQIVDIENNKQNKIKVGNLAAIRDFSHVKDTVKAYTTIMNKGNAGEIYNVGSGQGYTIKYILDTLIKYSKKEIDVEVDQSRFRPIDIKKVVADITKIKKLGWQPTSNIEDVLKKILEYNRSNQE